MKVVNKQAFIPIKKRLNDNKRYMDERIGIDKSYDTDYREITVYDTQIAFYYVNGLTEDNVIVELLKMLISKEEASKREKNINVWKQIEEHLVSHQITTVKTMDEAVDQMLSGLIVLFVDDFDQAFIIDVRKYPGRTPEEPDTERVIRGSRDGFTENIVENTGLIRRRIRDERLRNEMLRVGERSKTDVCMSYIQDVTNDDLIKITREKIQAIDIDAITMADKTVEEFLTEYKWNPYPLVRYTERPDVAADHLLDGHVLLIIDTSPSIIILPTTYFDHLEHAEEFRQTPAVGTFIRWIRLFAVLASLYLLPLWLLFAMNQELLPSSLSFIGPKEIGEIPLFIQIMLAYIGVEFLRMAAVHTPTPLATAMGLIAAVLIGEIAVDVGLFSPEVILYVAISTIGNYVTPSYELGVANKVVLVFFLTMTAAFGVAGFIGSITVHLLFITSLRSLRTPYMWPLIPFDFIALMYVVLRIPIPFSSERPSVIHPKNVYKEQSAQKQS